jgi:hypothetical protein
MKTFGIRNRDPDEKIRDPESRIKHPGSATLMLRIRIASGAVTTSHCSSGSTKVMPLQLRNTVSSVSLSTVQ